MGDVESTTSQVSGSDDILAKIGNAISVPGEEEAPAAEETAEVEESEEVEESDESDEVEETEDESEESEEVEETDDDEEEGPSLEAAQFAQLLGIDEKALIVGEDGSVSFQTKVDGEIAKVSLNDLIKSHQTEAHVTRKSQAVAEERKQFEAQVAQEVEALKHRANEIATVSQILEAQLTSEFNSINWDQLRVENPGEYAAKQQELQNKANLIAQNKHRASLALNQQMQVNSGKMEQERAQRLQAEAEALTTALPEWNDPEVAQKQHSDMSKFLTDTYGFAENDVSAVEDHRLFLLALDAKKYRENEKITKKVVKRVKALPKLTKPGSGKRGTAARLQNQAKEKTLLRLKKSGGTTQDLAAAISERINM